MSKEIEADGFVTRQSDLKQTERKVCANCKHLKHDDILRRCRCSIGHLIDVADWRMKYEVCDRWEKKE